MQVAECIVTNEVQPTPRYAVAWSSIITGEDVKERLLHSALLGLTLRSQLPFDVTALHGLILLYGPPGTGKTTLAGGLAHELSGLVTGGRARLIEVNPHGLMSSEHGQSQQKVFELLCDHIPLLADDKMPTVVVLDEVESMTVARSAASLSANPADVHRATDAVLEALDQVARQHPHLITVATSNFTESLDEAFVSRADASILVPLPNIGAIEAIIARTLSDFSEVYPRLKELSVAKGLRKVAEAAEGTDGRQVRKLVTEALATRRETVLDPNTLTVEDLLRAASSLSREKVRSDGTT